MSVLGVIPVYARREEEFRVIQRTIKTLRETAPDIEVMIVDDASPLETTTLFLEHMRERYAIQHVVRVAVNGGFSRAVNHGLQYALDHELDALLINADIEFIDHSWLRALQNNPADIIGALLLYPNGTVQHAGVYYCSPPDEPVLTGQDGYVSISELDPESHKLIGYSRDNDRIYRCERVGRGGSDRVGGYRFRTASRPYDGDMLEIVAPGGSTRITPNHELTAYWTRRAFAATAVYLMRRGTDWKIGIAAMRYGGGKQSGLSVRIQSEQADDLWVLKLCDTRNEALYEERRLAWTYGVPDLELAVNKPNERYPNSLSQQQQDEIWSAIDSESGALALLADHGMDPQSPLLRRNVLRDLNHGGQTNRNYVFSIRSRYPIRAMNLLPGFMEVPVDPGSGLRPDRQPFEIIRSRYRGDVYSLDVPPYGHYVSNKVVVHNSLINREFDHIYRLAPGTLALLKEPRICPVTAALQYIRLPVLQKIGLYDEDFRLGYEDVSFCLDAFKAGFTCAYEPKCVAVHHESIFRGKNPSDKHREWMLSSWETLHKKHAGDSFIEYVPTMLADGAWD